MTKLEEWHKEQAEKQKQTFLKRLKAQQDEIDHLKEENKKLKAPNKELKKAVDVDELCNRPNSGVSIVAQTVTSIVGTYQRGNTN